MGSGGRSFDSPARSRGAPGGSSREQMTGAHAFTLPVCPPCFFLLLTWSFFFFFFFLPLFLCLLRACFSSQTPPARLTVEVLMIVPHPR